jgi:hypothetical protein
VVQQRRRGHRSKDATGGRILWPWAAAFLSLWRVRAFAAAVWLAIGIPASPRRPRIAQLHSMVGMLINAMLAPTRGRIATDLVVLYGLLCSCACVLSGGAGRRGG